MIAKKWSGRGDLNSRLLGPEPSALPGCATPRLFSNLSYRKEFFKGSNFKRAISFIYKSFTFHPIIGKIALY
jgi:hypothetical protein